MRTNVHDSKWSSWSWIEISRKFTSCSCDSVETCKCSTKIGEKAKGWVFWSEVKRYGCSIDAGDDKEEKYVIVIASKNKSEFWCSHWVHECQIKFRSMATKCNRSGSSDKIWHVKKTDYLCQNKIEIRYIWLKKRWSLRICI